MSDLKQDRRQVSLSAAGRTALLDALRRKFPKYPASVYPDRWQEVTHVDRRTVDKMLASGQRVRQASIDSIFKDLGASFDEDVHLAAYIPEPASNGTPIEASESVEGTTSDEDGRDLVVLAPQTPIVQIPPPTATQTQTPAPAAPSNRFASLIPALVVVAIFVAGLTIHHIFFHHAPVPVASSQGTGPQTLTTETDSGAIATGGMELYDQFKADPTLMPDRWLVNGPAGLAAMKSYESPSYAVVIPKITIDEQNGLGISGITGNGQQGGIQSVRSFSPPFTVTALCNATAIHGDALRLAISSGDARKGLSVGFGSSDGSAADGVTGSFICSAPGAMGQGWQQIGSPLSPLPPATDIWYVLTIVVDASGKATAAVSSGGFPIGKATADVGHGPFYVVISQEDGSRSDTGPNQAYCGTIQVISEAEE